MTNHKPTKRALLSSMVSLVLCFAMLLGTTFAWFTDTASTSVNNIQAGTLKVDIVDTEGKSLQESALNFKNVDNDTNILWEPGVTFNTDKFQIKNTGTLALKYKIILNGVNGDAGLLEVIDFKVVKADGTEVDLNQFEESLEATKTSDAYYITATMKKEAGNGYQGKTLEGIGITVLATQASVEYDSNGNQYDVEATLPDAWNGTADAKGLIQNTDTINKTVHIDSAEQLKAFADAVSNNNTYSGYTVTLTTDIDLSAYTWSGIGSSNNVNFPSYFFNGTFDGQGHTIYNMTVSNLVGNNSTAGFFNGLGNNAIVKNLNFENAKVTSNHYAGVVVGYCNYTAGNGVVADPTALIENCSVNNAVVISKAHNTTGKYDDGDKVGGIAGFMYYSIKNCAVKNSTIIGVRDLGGIAGISYNLVSDCDIQNVAIVRDNTDININKNIDSFVGRKEGQNTITNCTGEAIISDLVTTVTEDTTFDYKGVTINMNDVESGYVMTSDNTGKKITLKNATYTGKTEGIYFGDYIKGSTDYNFNTQADNITVKNLKVSRNVPNVDNKLSAGVWVYGAFELNNCKMSGTTTTQTECTPYDVAFVNSSHGTVNGGEYESMFVYTHSEVELKGVKVGTIACMTNTTVKKALKIDKDCVIDTIEFVGSDRYLMNIEIEDDATINNIIYKSTTYTVDTWNDFVENNN